MLKPFFAGIPNDVYEVEWDDENNSISGRVKLANETPFPGGQAKVWKVKIDSEGEWEGDYALKVFLDPINRNRHSRAQFKNEVDARFEDNRFVSTINYGVITRDPDDGMETHCILRPWIEGKTLTKWLDEKHSLSEKIRTMKQIAGAVSFMHHAKKAPRLHNDLKPDNIIVKPDGKIVIIDFALCCAPDEVSKNYGGIAEFVGTDRWIAPELIPYKSHVTGDIKSGPENSSEYSDVWCLGSIFLYMLSGKDLWEYVGDKLDKKINSRSYFLELCSTNFSDNLTDYSDVIPGKEWISEILNRSLHLQRKERPGSSQFNHALARKDGTTYKVSEIPKGMEKDKLRGKLMEHFDCNVSTPLIKKKGSNIFAYVNVFGSEARPSYDLEGMKIEIQDNWPKRKEEKVQKTKKTPHQKTKTRVLYDSWKKLKKALPSADDEDEEGDIAPDQEPKPITEPPVSIAPSRDQVFIDLLLPNGKIIMAFLDVNEGNIMVFGRRELSADRSVSRKVVRLSLTSRGVELEALSKMTLDSRNLKKGETVGITGKHRGSVDSYDFEIELRESAYGV